ncbi:Ca-transporting ATPase [Fistulina hepatica ATCC 64428]|uniref:Calcium-transporting ATPase n=1 Tax=Fistulina hepatica ATCC 64428 TaxID=1128425 RepID=A0A0D7A850_9AGAR|nr:Ca-transporting ATPase [Fistulina hepatica ATCC 64428]
MSTTSPTNYMYPPGVRSSSPPASAYFSGDTDELRPLPDAESHFAYSTTLRRHHTLDGPPTTPTAFAHAVNAEASSLWSRFVGYFTGKRHDYDDVEAHDLLPTTTSLHDGHAAPREHLDTLSSKFAHYTVEDAISYFRTSASSGLLPNDVLTLRETHGYNEFTVATPEHVLLKFAKTIYESPLILLLMASATISAIMGNIDDAVSIAIAILIVLTVGFVQERRSEKSLEALNKLVPHHCHVIREGHTMHLLGNELVPGDIVVFSTGDRVPADVRMITAIDLDIDESSLTGETEARRKDTSPCDGAHGPIALADRNCIAYMGTLVRNGRGTGVVIATGTDTEFGVIFSMMQDVEEKRTPLQLKMDELATKLSIFSFTIIGFICLIGLLQKRSWLEMFTIGVSLAVAAIPEGLPIVTTVTLALGVLRMAKCNAIVKKLHSVESLGCVSVICADKTGTLTKNEQAVIEAYAVDEVLKVDPHGVVQATSVSPALTKAFEIGSLCNNAERNVEGIYVGHSTDVALLNVLKTVGLQDKRYAFKRLSERPFNSERKYMAVSGTHTDASSAKEMYYIKGSIEAILPRCKFYYVDENSTPGLDPNTRSIIDMKAASTAARGLRIIAIAYGYGNVDDDDDGNGLVFVGFQAMFDPPRKGVGDSVGLLQAGGVHVVMITGDAEQTAVAIARDLGLRVGAVGNGHASYSSYVLTGREIDQMSKAQLKERVANVCVFARTTPRHKLAIVEAFQSRGDVVAMTGDGVNDAPALKMADIGLSMGKSGTDVAKEAADVILVDDNFSTILPAVEEGKSIFHNIQNFLSFQLSTSIAALTLITLSTMFGLSNPLNAMQILFINILMDGPPSQSLGVDPVDPVVMKRPPRKKDAAIITMRLMYRVLFSGSIIVVGVLLVYVFALDDDKMSRREQTMTFTAFVFLDLVSAVQNRSIACGLTQNKMLVASVSISFFTLIGFIYVPLLQGIFQTEALPLRDIGLIFLLAAVSFTIHQLRREYERRTGIEEDSPVFRLREVV